MGKTDRLINPKNLGLSQLDLCTARIHESSLSTALPLLSFYIDHYLLPICVAVRAPRVARLFRRTACASGLGVPPSRRGAFPSLLTMSRDREASSVALWIRPDPRRTTPWSVSCCTIARNMRSLRRHATRPNNFMNRNHTRWLYGSINLSVSLTR